MFKSVEKTGVRQEGQARVLKSETRTVTRGGVTETVTTEVIESYSSGGQGASKNVRTVTSHSSDHRQNDGHHFQHISSEFNDMKIEEKSSHKTADDGGKEKSGRIHSLMSKFGKKPEQKPKHESSSDSSDSDSDEEEFAKECLKVHNEKRKKHGTEPLKLSKSLNKYAKKWAQKLAKEDSFRHRDDNKYGENIFMKWSSNPHHKISGSDAVESWYDEIRVHEFGREPTGLRSGHFTQVIWKSTKEMGVAKARSKSGKIIVVANYDPAGNFIGRFAENVPPVK